eukprot:gene886-9797_t
MLLKKCSKLLSPKTRNISKKNEIKIDFSRIKPKKAYDEFGNLKTKEKETFLTKHLKSKIISLGPLSVASFMNEALLNPEHGYYYKERNKEKDIFGEKGDFITNPEISQIYSELIGIWTYTQWKNLGKPKKFRLVELGPGKGTLMHDIIRTSSKYNDFKDSLERIHLIDASPNLMKQQIKKLCDIEISSILDTNQQEIFSSSSNGCKISWHGSLEDVPNDIPNIIIAHEFFDALPVYQFEYTKRGWSEVLVDFDDSKDSPYHFKYVLAPAPSIALRTLQHLIDEPEEIGKRVELCPAANGVIDEISSRINEKGGSALIIDYGEENNMGFTLRGIKNHKFEFELSSPGNVDLSVMVNFESLKKNLANKNVDVFGSIKQSDFLYQMGIDARMAILLKNPHMNDKTTKNLIDSYEKLTSDEEMGSIFKMICISTKGSLNPPGFEIIPPI